MPRTLPFGLQLYTVRDQMARDPRGTLLQVKAAGYDHVELAGYAGMAFDDFRAALADASLTPVSMHVGLDQLDADPDSVIAECIALGVRYAAVGYAVSDTLEGWADIAARLGKAGALLAREGLRLCYHNHAHEFAYFGKERAFDLIFSSTDPEHLSAEIDVFWVRHAGYDPADIIRKYADRCAIVHVKDAAPEGREPIFADLGTGMQVWPPIFEAAREAGAEWYIVEQDLCPGDPIHSIRVAAEFMKQAH